MRKLLQLLADNRGPRAAVHDDETTLYVYDAIVATDAEAEFWGGVSAQSIVPRLLRAQEGLPLTMRINSPGGDVFGAQAIVNAMRQSKARITVEIDGLAASAASVIAMAGDTVRISDGAMMMIHNAWTVAIGNASDMLDTAALLEKVDDTIASQYADKSKKDKEYMAGLMAAETWFTASEALAAGLVDEVIKAGAKPQAKAWNLAAYSKAPRAVQTPAPDTLSADHARALLARIDKPWRRAA